MKRTIVFLITILSITCVFALNTTINNSLNETNVAISYNIQNSSNYHVLRHN